MTLLAATQASAQTSRFPQVTYPERPEWETAPSRAQMDAAYPRAGAGAEGAASLDCEVRRDGRLSDCVVISEAPARGGFGQAARDLVRYFRLAPFPDRPFTPESRVIVPFRFDPPGAAIAFERPSVMLGPRWRSEPDPATDFPASARDAGFHEGEATLSCAVGSDNSLIGCAVESVTPEGHGFEQSALALAERMVINPWTTEGRPASSARVSVPFRFVDPHASESK